MNIPFDVYFITNDLDVSEMDVSSFLPVTSEDHVETGAHAGWCAPRKRYHDEKCCFPLRRPSDPALYTDDTNERSCSGRGKQAAPSLPQRKPSQCMLVLEEEDDEHASYCENDDHRERYYPDGEDNHYLDELSKDEQKELDDCIGQFLEIDNDETMAISGPMSRNNNTLRSDAIPSLPRRRASVNRALKPHNPMFAQVA